MTYAFLEDKIFTLRHIDGQILSEHCTFCPGGRLSGYQHGRHWSWEIIDGFLCFRDHRGEVTDKFDRIELIGSTVAFRGRLHDRADDYWLVMTENAPQDLRNLPTFNRGDHVAPKRLNGLAVLVRSHRADEKFANLMEKLDTNRRGFDVYAMLDTTKKELPTGFSNVVYFSEQKCIDLGLTRGQPHHLFHWHGDIAMSYAVRELEGYAHYLMLDDDLDLASDDASYCNLLGDLLRERPDIDFGGLHFEHRRDGYPTLLSLLPERLVYYSYYPAVLLSARAANFIFSLRQIDMARGTPYEKLTMCEGFVPSMLKAGGFRCCDLNDLIPSSYSHDFMRFQMSGYGLPMSARIKPPAPQHLIHAVYTDEEFLRRLGIHFRKDHETDWTSITNILKSRLGSGIASELMERFLVDAPAGIRAQLLPDKQNHGEP